MARKPVAKNTEHAYLSGWRTIAYHVDSLPPDPYSLSAFSEGVVNDLVAWIDGLSGKPSPDTIGRYRSAINHFYHAAGLMAPGQHPAVDDAIARYERRGHRPPETAATITPDIMSRLMQATDSYGVTEAKAKRDRALLCLGAHIGAEREALVALQWNDLHRTPTRLRWRLRSGRSVNGWLETRPDARFDPVKALDEWEAACYPTPGPRNGDPVLRTVNRYGHIGGQLGGRAVIRTLQGLAETANLANPSSYKSRSLTFAHKALGIEIVES